jgi:hypothetical protein
MKIIALLFALFLNFHAQEPFEGILTYNVTIEGENEEMLREVMPHTYTLYFGKENFRFDLDGGMMPEFMGDIITFNKVGKSYILKEETNTAYVIEGDEPQNTDSVDKIVPLKETMMLKDYKCKGYQILFNEPGDGLVRQTLWLTTELNLNLPKGNNHGISAFFRDDLEGFALMIENHFESDIGNYKIIISLDKIEETYLPRTMFSIPDNFKINVLEDFESM